MNDILLTNSFLNSTGQCSLQHILRQVLFYQQTLKIGHVINRFLSSLPFQNKNISLPVEGIVHGDSKCLFPKETGVSHNGKMNTCSQPIFGDISRLKETAEFLDAKISLILLILLSSLSSSFLFLSYFFLLSLILFIISKYFRLYRERVDLSTFYR